MLDNYYSPYEISLWEDVLTFVVKYEGEDETREFRNLKDIPQGQKYSTEAQYYKERKIAIIGSNTMTTPIAAFNITFNQDVNGSNKLTFSIYSRYFDEETEQFYENPFINLLVNERKVKIWHKNKWTDLIIKNVQENSDNYLFTYTAQDLFINELSKTGFDLQFDTKLENNQGTITKLAERILEGSDWQLKTGDGANDLLRQFKSEPLYIGTAKEKITAKEVLSNTDFEIPAGAIVYLFYSNIVDKVTNFFQFIYIANNDDPVYDDDHNITNGTLYYIDNIEYDENNIPTFVSSMSLTTQYRGERVVRNLTTKYIESIDKYVAVFEDSDKEEIYGYTETEYISAATTKNLITNPNGFTSLTGWQAEPDGATIELYGAPSIFDIPSDYNGQFYSYIKATFNGGKIFNSGINDSRSLIENFTKDEIYRLKVRVSTAQPDEKNGTLTLDNSTIENLTFVVAEYALDKGKYEISKDGNEEEIIYLNFQNSELFTPVKPEYLGTIADKTATSFSTSENQHLFVGDYIYIKSKGQIERAKIVVANVTKNDNGEIISYNYRLDKLLNEEIYSTEKGNKPTIATEQNQLDSYFELYADCERSLSYEKLITTKIGLFITSSTNSTYYFEDIQLFKEVTDAKGAVVYPDSIPEAIIKTKYYYFEPSQLDNIESIDQLTYIYIGYEPNTDYEAAYSSNFEKVRSITASESNRFNLIQTLCETFECWAIFEVEHNEATGQILLEKDVEDGDIENLYRQRKFVSFKEVVGKTNYAGFKNGINLQSTQRTLASEGIVSKLIVKNNSNEFAENGFCTIARADENPSGENFIYNFDYYISQGMLDLDVVTNDLYLYSEPNKYLGYYQRLRNINKNREENINLQAELLTAISTYESEYQTYSLGLAAIEEQIIEKKNEIQSFCGASYEEVVEAVSGYAVYTQTKDQTISAQKVYYTKSEVDGKEVYTKVEEPNDVNISNYYEDITTSALKEKFLKDKYGAEALNIYVSLAQLQASRNQYERNTQYYDYLLNGNEEDIVGAYAQKAELEKQIEDITTEKEELEKEFYKKYSRFIQEGSWISEDYIDDNLYYLDAESTLYTSAYPQVSYTFRVLDLQEVEDYENYRFDIGDKTYVEDTEFFGWIIKDGLKTPRKEEIVVTNISYGVDDPTKTTITVKNYKTHFEDLFQRITATTQSVQYSTGEYNRAAGAVTNEGTIDTNVLQNSLFNNSVILQNASDESVTWDSTGITSVNLSIPAQIIRITSGGLFVSNDGGENWSTGITANGINASFITAGQIDVSVINILNGMQKTFRWDKLGINAYAWDNDANGGVTYNLNKFVRFDQHGIYGIDGNSNFNPLEGTDTANEAEEKIWNNAQFALTWKGFMLKSNSGGGYISITSTDDFGVYDPNGNQRVKIGRLDTTSTLAEAEEKQEIYGIRINNANGESILETIKDGSLWLKDRLNIGTTTTNTVGIGNLGNLENESIEEHGERVIDANDAFVVYADGHVNAASASISGIIEATGGSIGNLSITQTGLEAVNKDDNGNTTSSMVLNNNGLTLTNNLFEIKNSKGDSLLKFDPNNQEAGLQLATGGTFEGIITATGGNIGGFTISDSALYTGTAIDNTPLALYGKEGKIYAKNITLGENAYIENYIELGNAYICNPKMHNNSIIKILNDDKTTAAIDITTTGQIFIGNDISGVIIDGAENLIKSSNYVSGSSGWSINSISAEFNNIIARGSLKATVFEYGEVQTVGGIVVIRPSSIIKASVEEENDGDISTYKLILENSTGFSIGDICRITTDNSVIDVKVVELRENNTICCQTKIKIPVGVPIVNLGINGSVGLTLNATDTANFGASKALTVFKTTIDNNNNLTLENKIILGLLPKDLPDGTENPYNNSYGLYAENVILHGSLVTKTEMSDNGISINKYSGLGTDSTIKENSEIFETAGNILFWAGAASADSDDIQKSPFRVDSNGNFYAGSGYFEGSIITNATITASEIRTAKLTGWKEKEEAALTIYNAEKGIEFKIPYTGSENIESDIKEKTVFLVSHTGLELTDIDIKINKNLSINQNHFANINNTGLFLNEDNINLKVNNESYIELNEQVIYHNTLTDFKDKGFQMNKTVSFKKVSGGYNLYIDE